MKNTTPGVSFDDDRSMPDENMTLCDFDWLRLTSYVCPYDKPVYAGAGMVVGKAAIN